MSSPACLQGPHAGQTASCCGRLMLQHAACWLWAALLLTPGAPAQDKAAERYSAFCTKYSAFAEVKQRSTGSSRGSHTSVTLHAASGAALLEAGGAPAAPYGPAPGARLAQARHAGVPATWAGSRHMCEHARPSPQRPLASAWEPRLHSRQTKAGGLLSVPLHRQLAALSHTSQPVHGHQHPVCWRRWPPGRAALAPGQGLQCGCQPAAGRAAHARPAERPARRSLASPGASVHVRRHSIPAARHALGLQACAHHHHSTCVWTPCGASCAQAWAGARAAHSEHPSSCAQLGSQRCWVCSGPTCCCVIRLMHEAHTSPFHPAGASAWLCQGLAMLQRS